MCASSFELSIVLQFIKRMPRTKLGTFVVVERLKLVFKLCGLWPSENTSKCSSVLYNFYSLTINVIFLFLYDLSTSVYIFFLEDVQEATDNLCMSLTLIALFAKVVNFKISLRRIRTALRMSEEFMLENDEEYVIVDRQISFYNKLAVFLFCSANVAGSFNYTAVMMSEEVKLPVLAWFPFGWESNSTVYVLLYAYQVIGLVIQSNLNVSMDLFAAYLMHVASIKLQILGNRFENLSKFMSEGQVNQQIVDDSLARCVVTYQHLWK